MSNSMLLSELRPACREHYGHPHGIQPRDWDFVFAWARMHRENKYDRQVLIYFHNVFDVTDLLWLLYRIYLI